jgi:hypothetical protein
MIDRSGACVDDESGAATAEAEVRSVGMAGRI